MARGEATLVAQSRSEHDAHAGVPRTLMMEGPTHAEPGERWGGEREDHDARGRCRLPGVAETWLTEDSGRRMMLPVAAA
jgi:hypothetical protein